MKKITLKSLSKSARTASQKSLQVDLASLLETKLAEQSQGSKKLKKEIKKGAKKLAKKVSKQLKYSKEELIAMNSEIAVTPISGPAKAVSNASKTSTARANSKVKSNTANSAPARRSPQRRAVNAKVSTTTPVVKSPKAQVEEPATTVSENE